MGGRNAPGYHRDYQRRRYAERMAEAKAILGGRCVRCGATEGKLDIDHVDPATKTKALSAMHLWRRDRWLAELEKCQLLCASCHGHKTMTQDGGRTTAGWNKGLRMSVGSPRRGSSSVVRARDS